MFTALIGLVGWLLAARLLHPAQVGHAAAFVNGFLLVAAIAELGLSQAAMRWLTHAGSLAPRLLRRVYAGALASCLVAAVLWTLVAPVDRWSGLGPVGGRALFVVAALVWMLFHVQDFVLTGLGAARWVPVENVGFGIVRIGLLVLLADRFGALGLILSWVIGTALCVVAVSAGLLRNAHRATGPGRLPTRREATLTAGGTWFAMMGTTLLNNLVPVVVVARYGAATGAVFAVVWLGLNALDVASIGFGNAAVVRLRGGSWRMFGQAARRVLPLFAGPLLVAGLLAHPLLQLFGPLYAAEGQTMLRLVVSGALLRAVVVLVAAVHFARDRVGHMAALHWASALSLVALAGVAPTGRGLALLGAGYLVIQVVLAVLAMLDLVGSSSRERGDGPLRTPRAARRR
ncbi:hypothetical protein D9V37_12765 [Nocardioides mangrovicus]|uniref:Polysaccharide biosynthesis protein n=2 Tax=Nocardioides mangrovicus TaxID=2478913 RepID=A0A3L8P0A5_9ACTN|nr:hypothetical protein D9V37_12765 [Nocardioides mangrovicus]